MTSIAPEFNASTARYRRLARFAAYMQGEQYKGRPDFWTGGSDGVPLRERAPCIVYPLPRNATLEAVRFTFGEGRFPSIAVKPEEDGAQIAGLSLSKDDAEIVQGLVVDAVEQAGLKTALRGLLKSGLSTCTGVAIVVLRDGKFVVDRPRAADCIPTFQRDGDPTSPVVALTWTYQYDAEIPNAKTGEPEAKRYYFRRDIDAAGFTDYEPVEVEIGVRPKWAISNVTLHGWSFCPVIWARNLPDEHCSDIDGTSILDGVLDEFDALNFALSQRHRGIAFFGTPQPYETGVDEDDGPTANARTSTPGYSAGSQPLGRVAPKKAGGRAARATSPDSIWSYQGENVTVGLVETTGKAFEVATAHVDDISARLKQSMGVVLANAADTLGKGDMSAKFLALVYAPLLSLVDDLRECWWSAALRPIVEMILRMIMERGGAGILLRNAVAVAAILRGRKIAIEGGDLWMAPQMAPQWGPYFSASDAEVGAAVTAAATAKREKLIPEANAVQYVAAHFGVTDVAKAMDEIADEAEAAQEPGDDAADKDTGDGDTPDTSQATPGSQTTPMDSNPTAAKPAAA